MTEASDTLKVWLDGDACPGSVKQFLFRTAIKRRIPLILVANTLQQTPPSPYISARCVSQELDAADVHILEHVCANDIVITADIPFAAEAVKQGAHVLTPRGRQITATNAGEFLAQRNLKENLRSEGLISSGPPPFSTSDQRQFANQFSRILQQAQHKTR